MRGDLESWQPPAALDGQSWLVDTHAHLADQAFDADREGVLARAAAAGVRLIVAVGADLDSSWRSLEIARRTAGVVGAVGIHPHDAMEATLAGLGRVREWAGEPEVVAVGEVGLDYYRMRAPKQEQLRALEAQLAIADEVGKPVLVHDRDAHDDLRAMLLPWAEARRRAGRHGSPGVLHCFSGDLTLARAAIAAGFFVSFAGNVTFARRGSLAEVAEQVDLRGVVLETDSPYLAPMPTRGARNEPSRVLTVAEWLATRRGISLREIVDRTTANALRLFGLA